MSYVKGDRVRMVNNPAQVGTVTGERDQMFLSFMGIAWDHEDFGFVAPSNLELDVPSQNYTETGIGVTSKPSPDGKVLTDWQTRAERAEARVAAVRAVAGCAIPSLHGSGAVIMAVDVRDLITALDADQ